MLESPEWEREIGMEWYLTDSEGVGGILREHPEDFVVEEEGINGTARVLLAFGKKAPLKPEGEGKYLHVVMEKVNWETTEAVRRISRVLGLSLKDVSFAGTKDKRAVTAQWICLDGVKWRDLKIDLKGIFLHTPVYSRKKIRLGDLKGNWFRIKKKGAKKAFLPEIVPNYFGHQRFGVYRFVTHVVGRKVLEEDYEGAILEYLCRTSPYEPEETRKARERLKRSLDFEEALETFPKNLRHERRILSVLARGESFKKAFKTFHPKMQSMFLHSFQSFLFNKILSKRLETGDLKDTIVPGYGVVPDDIEREVLEEEGVELKDFKKFKKHGTRGEKREALVEVRERWTEGNTVGFFLKKGSYATVVLREVMKPATPEGFLYRRRRGEGEN